MTEQEKLDEIMRGLVYCVKEGWTEDALGWTGDLFQLLYERLNKELEDEGSDKIFTRIGAINKYVLKKDIGVKRMYEVWMEGHSGTQPAELLGTYHTHSFAAACDLAVRGKFAEDYSFKENWIPETLTYWGCRLFDNEIDARRSFG